jgi:DNA helicase HerA-like ATPase
MQNISRRIGIVASIEGWRLTGVICRSEVTKATAPADADHVSPPAFGDLVKIKCPSSIVYGLVSRMWMDTPHESLEAAHRMVEVELLGEIAEQPGMEAAGRFQRGVSSYPTIGADILETTSQDVAKVYAIPGAPSARVGSLHQDPARPVHVLVDSLLGKHFAVLGTTGSGKSCATTLILRAVLDAYPKGHIVILDPHNEYARAFGEHAEILDPSDLQLPYWILNFEESVATFCSQDASTREYEAAILKDAILTARRGYASAKGGAKANISYITVDTPVPYFLADVIGTIEKGLGRLEKPGGALPYLRLQSRIEALQCDDRFGFMFCRDPIDDTLADIVCRVLRLPVDHRPITIVDLSGVPSEIVDVFVSVMCRIIFDFALWSGEPQAVPVLLVCEEAHRYIPRDERLGFGPTRRAITRIAMEGRKYGVSLCLVSNRPSELSATILAQCNTIFALRMSNQQDHEFVRSSLPEGMGGLVAALPALRPQEAIVVGEGVSMPLRLRFDDLDDSYRPRSMTAEFSSGWRKDELGRDFVRDTISRWRHQRRSDEDNAAVQKPVRRYAR